MLSDEELWDVVCLCTVQKLQTLLALANILRHHVPKENLQLRLFHAIKLGLQPAETPEDWAKSVKRSITRKLTLEV